MRLSQLIHPRQGEGHWSRTTFPDESDWAGTGRAGSPTPPDSFGSGLCPELETQEYMSTLMYSAFQTSPTESFCGVLSKPCRCPHGPSTPGPICITQLPPIGALAVHSRILGPSPPGSFQKESMKDPGRQRTFPRSYRISATLLPSPQVQLSGKQSSFKRVWKYLGCAPPFPLASGLSLPLPTEQQPWAKFILH